MRAPAGEDALKLSRAYCAEHKAEMAAHAQRMQEAEAMSWQESVAAQRSLKEASEREASDLHAAMQLSLQSYLIHDDLHSTRAPLTYKWRGVE